MKALGLSAAVSLGMLRPRLSYKVSKNFTPRGLPESRHAAAQSGIVPSGHSQIIRTGAVGQVCARLSVLPLANPSV